MSPRISSRPLGGVLVTLMATSLALAAAISPVSARGATRAPTHKPAVALAPGAWSARYTVGAQPVTDSQGNSWAPAVGVIGGTVSNFPGGIGSTGSPQLYQPIRTGIQRWTVPVPGAGRYAVNLLISDTTGVGARTRVFSVSARGSSTSTPLATNLDVVAAVKGWQPYHVTGIVPVTGTTLTLTFTAVAGTPIASALELESDGPIRAVNSLLDDTFYGPAGAQPNPTLWNYTTGTGWEGNSSVQDYTASRTNSALDGQGNLAITAIRQDVAGAPYTSARLNTQDRFTFGYSHVAAVMRLPAGSGMWPAFWALGANQPQVNWPSCGEIDVLEGLGANPADVSGHIHSLGNGGDPIGYLNQHIASLGTDWTSPADTTQAFHTYAVDYSPGSITFTFDGHAYFVAAPEDLAAGETWPFLGGPNYLILDLAIGDSPWTGSPPAEPLGTTHTMLIKQISVTS